MRLGKVRIQVDSAPKFVFGIRPIPGILPHDRLRDVSLSKIFVQLQSLLRFRVRSIKITDEIVGERQFEMSERVVRINVDGLLKILDSFRKILPSPRSRSFESHEAPS